MNRTLQREVLRKIIADSSYSQTARELAELRLNHSEDHKLLTGYVNQLLGEVRIYPTHLPTQTSGRWSTLNPPLTNFPRACINITCPKTEHEWTDHCWSIRDILLPDDDEVLITFDMDNVEGRIHDLIVNDTKALQAHAEGYDLHTLTYCDIFHKQYPSDKKNPHTSEIDAEWRRQNNWQGKDTRKRVLAKNFNHGSKYTKTYKFVHRIPGIERYGITYKQLEQLAKNYIASKGTAWQAKLDIMNKIQKEKISRTLYGFRRVFFDSSEETGREGFSHMISGTVSDYINHTIFLFDQHLNRSIRLLHNAHDGLKLAVKRDNVPTHHELKQWIERDVGYQGRYVTLTATVKVHV